MTTLLRVGLCVTGDRQGTVLKNAGLLIEGSRIVALLPAGTAPASLPDETVDASELVLIPGFVQTHVHLCQTLFRGMAEELELLDWLRQRIFPFEAAHDEESMYASAVAGIAELVRSGTTTILDMGSVRHEEAVIRAIGETGLRAFVGKAMMDLNEAFPALKETTRESLSSTLALATRWHNSFDGRVKYAVAPRFVLSCTDELLREAYAMTRDFKGMLFHTHASENRSEVRAVRDRCRMENVEFLSSIGVLSTNSCLAHCVHLDDREEGILSSAGASVAHCPSSNLKLGSGIASVPRMLERGINVSLGADGAPCNNTLDMFQEMRLASLLQKQLHGPASMPARSVFAMATIAGARALGMEAEIGSLEPGKKADLVLLDLARIWNPPGAEADIYSTLVYSGSPENVHSVMIDGRWVYRNASFVALDERKAVHDARKAWSRLLRRMER
jgi:cytosine/adenosine deaminase-related metal-dependent hydrolase